MRLNPDVWVGCLPHSYGLLQEKPSDMSLIMRRTPIAKTMENMARDLHPLPIDKVSLLVRHRRGSVRFRSHRRPCRGFRLLGFRIRRG